MQVSQKMAALPQNMVQKIFSSRLTYEFVVCLLFLVIAWSIVATSSSGTIDLVLPNSRITIDYENGELDYARVIRKLIGEENESVRGDVLAVLERNGVYRYGGEGLVDRIGRQEPTEDYAAEFIGLVREKRGPFRGSSFFDLSDGETASKIQTLDYYNPFVSALRRLILKQTPENLWPKPFQVKPFYSVETLRGHAVVCKKSQFFENNIRIFSPNSGESIRLSAEFELLDDRCEKEPNLYVQMNKSDGKLIGLSDGGKVAVKAEPKGYTEDREFLVPKLGANSPSSSN